MTSTEPKTVSRGIAFLLASLTALGPFSIDTYPVLPDIGANLHATPIEVQQTLTAYLLPFCRSWLCGTARFPMRSADDESFLSHSCALFGLSLFGCLFATRIEHLWLLRALKACRQVPVS